MEVPGLPRQARLTRVLRPLSLGLFAFYLVWNAVWIGRGRVPPSILHEITGIPCPTTGGTRSFMALCRGDWLQALLWNPLVPVYLVLFAYSLFVLMRQALRGERLVLKPAIGWMWFAALAMGWAAKFALGPKYW